MNPAELSCRDALEFLSAYLEAELAPDVRARFDRHLALCASCRAYLESYRATVALARSAYADPDTAEPAALVDPFPAELLAAILASRENPTAADTHRLDPESGSG